MADGTSIEWSDATWQIVTGCSVLSPGCTNCYAMRLAGTRLRNHASREGLTKATKAGPVWNGEVRFNRVWLAQPLEMRRPRMIFVAAHGDLFHEGVLDEWLDEIFAMMAICPHHVFQVLTKRPERMRAYLTHPDLGMRVGAALMKYARGHAGAETIAIAVTHRLSVARKPLPNVWLGVSAEDQRRADERVPILLDTPAAVRWVSAEPLLGPIDFNAAWHGEDALASECWGDCAWCTKGLTPLHNCQRGFQEDATYERDRPGLDWVVVGGESGPGARPMHPDWARSIRDQCAEAGVPFLFKQHGAWTTHHVGAGGALEPPVPISAAFAHPRVWNDDVAEPVAKDATAGDVFREGADLAFEVGKKTAGRLLDGVLHDGFPAKPKL